MWGVGLRILMAAKKLKSTKRPARRGKRPRTTKPKPPTVEFDHLFIGATSFAISWDFWTRVMGLEATSKWGNPEYAGTVALGAGSVTVAQGEEGPYDELGYHVMNGKPQLYLRTKDVDALHKKLAGHGAKVLRGPLTTHYGARCFSVEGPDGMVVVITQAK